MYAAQAMSCAEAPPGTSKSDQPNMMETGTMSSSTMEFDPLGRAESHLKRTREALERKKAEAALWEADYKKLLKAAEDVIKAATECDALWCDTRPMLRPVEDAISKLRLLVANPRSLS